MNLVSWDGSVDDSLQKAKWSLPLQQSRKRVSIVLETPHAELEVFPYQT